jgi:hypothetical protein
MGRVLAEQALMRRLQEKFGGEMAQMNPKSIQEVKQVATDMRNGMKETVRKVSD